MKGKNVVVNKNTLNMNNWKFIIIIICTGTILGSCHKTIILNTNNINLYQEYNGKSFREGLWVERDSIYQVSISRYKDGVKNGKEIKFDSLTHTIGFYKNGTKNGWFKYYTNKGILMQEYLFINDTIKKKKIHKTYSPKF